MNTFFRQSINEYQRQINLKELFAIETQRLTSTIESINRTKFEDLPTDRRESRSRLSLLLLSPLVEIAWADGRVTRRESEAILQVAAAYGLVDDEACYCELVERMTSRPVPQTVGRMWQDFHRLFEKLSESEREQIAFCLDVQTRFVAEQSSDNFMAFLRGEPISDSEREALQIVKMQLENAQSAVQSPAEKRADDVSAIETKADGLRENAAPVTDYSDESKAALEDYDLLVPLVPLVKIAWAESRVTKRERLLIFEAAERMGIKSGSTAHRRLEEWLEFHPTHEFFAETLERLRDDWKNLPEDERALRRLDLLSDCLNIAEASGGAKNFPSGGARVCDEEIAAVKYIAQKLNTTGAAGAVTH